MGPDGTRERMIGPTKWRLLVIYVVTVCTATCRADDLRIEHGQNGGRKAKNLLPPFQPFSIVDNLKYTLESSPKTPAEFGSFRFVDPAVTVAPSNRRSDNFTDTLVLLNSAPDYRVNSINNSTATSQHHVVEIIESIDLTDSARRSGFIYPETTFVPQGYSEDHTAAFDAAAIRRPFFDAGHGHHDFPILDESNEHLRLMELFGQTRNHPEAVAESSIHPVRVLPDQMPAESQRLRSYPTIYYQNNDYRSRHYFPPKPEFFNDFPVVKKYPAPWKSRTPRVIFPIPDLPSAPGSSYNSDSVVFK